jgi:hypothetical protein
MIGAFKRNAPFGTEIAFQKGFERVGGCSLNCIDPSYKGYKFDYDADVTIVFKYIEDPEYKVELAKTNGLKFVYQPDDLRFNHIKLMMQEMLAYCKHALTFDDDGAELAKSYGYKSARRLLLTADNKLYKPLKNTLKSIDVCFIGSVGGGENHAGRRRMIDIVSKMRDIKFMWHNSVYDIQRLNAIYNSSKIVLNHATDVGQPFGQGYGYQCRHFEVGMTKTCLLSNKVVNENCLKGFREFSNEEELKDSINYLLRHNKDAVSHSAEELYKDIIDNHLPEHRALELLKYFKELQ